MRVFEIEATNFCNASCRMCPRDALTRPRGTMSWETFQAVADKVLAFGQTELFSFSGIGEPTLNPLLARFIAYVSPYVQTNLSTNGSLLSEAAIQALLEAGLHTLILSFNGADATTYEQIMVNLHFDQVQTAMRRLVSMADGRIKRLANVTVSDLTQSQLPAIKSRLNDWGIEQIMYSPCHSRGGNFRDGAICSTPPPPATTRCDLFASTTFVAWNGLILACCQDLTGAGVMGDLIQKPMEELAAERDQILREGVHFPMCPDCNDLNRLSQDEPPPGTYLNEWIYRLYESEDSRTATLTEALRLADRQLANAHSQVAALEAENMQLHRLVAAYEKGHFIRFMRQVARWRKKLGL
jgi:organic radical activating enzyme